MAPAGLRARRLDRLYDTEQAFVSIYGASPNAFWLDSSASGGERGRFSFMGDSEGPASALVTYDVETGKVRVEQGGEVSLRSESIFAYLDSELGRSSKTLADLPFEFDCGFAGYLGYELKAECDSPNSHRAVTPDAALIRATRVIAFDHLEGHTYLLAQDLPLHQICPPREGRFDAAAEAERWMDEKEEQLATLPVLADPPSAAGPVELTLRRSRARYVDDIAACHRCLRAGHSYEICLTNQVTGEIEADPLELYRALRRANPAPFAAYLRFGDLAVLSSSPERFLAVDRQGWAEARPIKGTSRRGVTPSEDARLAAALRSDEKSRAENVTIVDLLRNDLGRVCEVGTVAVPELMQVESYETVHQLVSSVRGRLRRDVGAAQCVRACFPPGSMTGAPKLRTMEILDELEGEARGVYAGAIGYFGVGGSCDLSVAIRAIVLQDGAASVGAGGAIVVQSDAAAEFEEMLLKAWAPISAMTPSRLSASEFAERR